MMLGLPERYKVNKEFKPSTFIPKELPPVDKRRLKGAISAVMLAYQITGEEIPSVIDENHYIQAVLFFDMKLKSIKDAAFISGIIQSRIKELCVIRFYDTASEVYSFAVKRLNLQDKNEIVIDESYITPPFPTVLMSDNKREMLTRLDFEAIINKTDKLCYYYELMTRAFLVTYKGLFLKQNELLAGILWYNGEDVRRIYSELVRLRELKAKLAKAALPKEKMEINGEIKKVLEGLRI